MTRAVSRPAAEQGHQRDLDAARRVLRLAGEGLAALEAMLEREGRRELAQACFDFLPARAELDLAGWPDVDIFAH